MLPTSTVFIVPFTTSSNCLFTLTEQLEITFQTPHQELWHSISEQSWFLISKWRHIHEVTCLRLLQSRTLPGFQNHYILSLPEFCWNSFVEGKLKKNLCCDFQKTVLELQDKILYSMIVFWCEAFVEFLFRQPAEIGNILTSWDNRTFAKLCLKKENL